MAQAVGLIAPMVLQALLTGKGEIGSAGNKLDLITRDVVGKTGSSTAEALSTLQHGLMSYWRQRG